MIHDLSGTERVRSAGIAHTVVKGVSVLSQYLSAWLFGTGYVPHI